MYRITVETIFCDNKGGFSGIEPVRAEFEFPSIQLAELIRLAVESQLREGDGRYKDGQEKFHGLQRQYLLNEDIDELAAAGKVSVDAKFGPQLDQTACIEAALEGFRRKRYFVVANGTRPAQLNDSIILLPNTEVQFVRLMPLAGG